MAVSSNGRAYRAELLAESVVLVLFQYGAGEALAASAGEESLPGLQPRYDARSGQLWLGDTLLKTFRRADSNQEKTVCAFEEEDWPELIDDPLPPKGEIDPRERLRDTLYALNQSLGATAGPPALYRLKFRADKSGEAVRRQTIDVATDTAAQPPRVWRPGPEIGRSARPLRRRCK